MKCVPPVVFYVCSFSCGGETWKSNNVLFIHQVNSKKTKNRFRVRLQKTSELWCIFGLINFIKVPTSVMLRSLQI